MSSLLGATTRRRIANRMLAIGCALLLAGALAPAVYAAGPNLTGMNWSSLNADQRRALQPLSERWSQMQPDQQRKWLAVSGNFKQLSADEQQRLHARMGDWARMSNAERMQTRRNFGTARDELSAGERKAKWDEFNNLDADERKALAPKSQPVRSTAPAARTQPLTVTLPERRN